MADDDEKSSTGAEALMIIGGLAILVVLWYFAGGPGKTDLRGLFLAPPQPLGSGGAYGPQFGTTSDSVPAPASDSGYTAPQY